MLFFRHSLSLEAAWRDVLTSLEADGWSLNEGSGSGRIFNVSACRPDCDTLRLYAVAREESGTSTITLRVIEPGEFDRRVRLPGRCEGVTLDPVDPQSRLAAYMPVHMVDLDRDGRLDVFLPRPREQTQKLPIPTEGDLPASLPGVEVQWDAYVMRGECGHFVGTFDGLPEEEHFAPPGRKGLVDLRAPVFEVGDDDEVRRIKRAFWFDGDAYVQRRRDRG